MEIKDMKKNNISILSHDKCTGCGACYNVCPVNAIHMEHDIDGFLSPIIDNENVYRVINV